MLDEGDEVGVGAPGAAGRPTSLVPATALPRPTRLIAPRLGSTLPVKSGLVLRAGAGSAAFPGVGPLAGLVDGVPVGVGLGLVDGVPVGVGLPLPDGVVDGVPVGVGLPAGEPGVVEQLGVDDALGRPPRDPAGTGVPPPEALLPG